LRAGWQTVADFVDAMAKMVEQQPLRTDRIRPRLRASRGRSIVESAVVTTQSTTL